MPRRMPPIARHGGRERGPDLEVTEEEGAFVEPLPPHPAGDLGVALAGVAGAAGGHDVVERVAPAAGEGEHAVALEWSVGGAAVGTATPGRLERGPLFVAEIVLDPIHAAFALPGGRALRLRSTAIRGAYAPANRRRWSRALGEEFWCAAVRSGFIAAARLGIGPMRPCVFGDGCGVPVATSTSRTFCGVGGRPCCASKALERVAAAPATMADALDVPLNQAVYQSRGPRPGVRSP